MKPASDDRPWVLVVDDSRVVRRALLRILEDQYNIMEAAHGVEAWRLLRQNSRVEVVITDIQMPEMNGYSFICKVRADDDPDLRELPVVVITSAEDDVTREAHYMRALESLNRTRLMGTVLNKVRKPEKR